MSGSIYLQYLGQEDWEFKANLATQQDPARTTKQEGKKKRRRRGCVITMMMMMTKHGGLEKPVYIFHMYNLLLLIQSVLNALYTAYCKVSLFDDFGGFLNYEASQSWINVYYSLVPPLRP